MSIQIENLVKTYDKLTAVNGISLNIRKGESFGFLGPNGAGKTTVMRIIYCFLMPSSGTVRVLGHDVTHDPGHIKSFEGVMPQDDNLDPDLSVLENLIVYARYFDIIKPQSLKKSWELLDFVGLRHRADDNVMSLSGGMRRRLLLARALLNDPSILILDEPTTGMDPHSRRSVWENLEMLKRQDTTLILTTHYMEEAENICDRVAIMDLGKIITIDTPQNLMDKHGGNLEYVYLKLTGRALEDF